MGDAAVPARRIFVYTFSSLGHVFPLVPTVRELAARGHEVLFTTGKTGAEILRKEGLNARAAEADLAYPIDESRGLQAMDDQVDVVLRQLGPIAAEIAEQVATYRPDLLMIDPFVWGAVFGAEHSGLPWVGVPTSINFLPRLGPRTRGQDVYALAFERRLAEVNTYRAGLGLAPFSHGLEVFARAPLTLAYTVRELDDPDAEFDPAVRFVGPGMWEPAGPPVPWLDTLDDRPLVLVSTSTEQQYDDKLVEAAIRAFADQPYQVVITDPTRARVGDLPTNVRLERYVPHSALLPRAACVICAGGLGTVLKSLSAGVPLVVVPFARDQPENARRVERAQAGVHLRVRDLDAASLRAAFQKALACRPGAARLSTAIARTGGARHAADLVETLLASGPR